MAWGGSFVFDGESGETEQQGGGPKKEVGGGSFVFDGESGEKKQQGGGPKKEVGGGSFVFNEEAASKQQQGTSEVKQETKLGAESPKLWEPASAQQSDPPRLQAGRTKEDLFKLYETVGSSAQEMSLRDMVERPKRPVRKNIFEPTSDKKPEGGTGARARGRKNHNQHHHRPNVPPSKTNVTVPPRANGNQTPEKYRSPSRSFKDFLQDDNSKKVGKESETLPRSRSAQTPETFPRAHNNTVSPSISPRIVIPEFPSRSPRSPVVPTESPKASFIKPTSGNQQPPRSKRMSPGPSPLSSPRPRRSSPLASASSPGLLGLEREPRSTDERLASSPRVAQKMGGASPLGSRTPSPARLGYEREPWSIDGMTPAISPRWGQTPGSASPLGTPRRSFVGDIGSPLGSVSSPARLGYEREPGWFEEMQKGQSPMRRSVSQRPEQMYSSTVSPFSSNKSSTRPARRASHSSEAMDSKSTDKSSSLGDFFGRTGTQKTAAPTIQHGTIRCSSCSSYTLMKTRCLVCGRIYCRSCVRDAMGHMPEGRKCTNTCVGRPLHSKYKNYAGKGCFWIPRASKIIELKLLRQEKSNPTPISMRSNNSTPHKHSTYTPNQRNKTHSKFSNRTPNQNMPSRMSISSNS